MKIVCTDDEKEVLIISLANSIHCPFEFTESVHCKANPNLSGCIECIRENIDWFCADGEEKDGECEKNCLTCRNSFSDEEDHLHCMADGHDHEEIVADGHTCNHWN